MRYKTRKVFTNAIIMRLYSVPQTALFLRRTFSDKATKRNQGFQTVMFYIFLEIFARV